MKHKLFACALICLGAVSLLFAGGGPPRAGVAVKIQEIEPFAYCCITYKGPYSDMESVINRLMTAMQGQNIPPAGNMITVYHTDPGKEDPMDSEWEVGFPVPAQAVVIQDPLIKKTWDHALVAAAVHTGPYADTGETIDIMFDWMEENGYVQDGPVLGKYLNMPGQVGESQLQTEIWIPVREK